MEGTRTTVVLTVGATAFPAAERAGVTGVAALFAVARAIPPAETAATLPRRPATTVVPIA
ncbi:hypothetical protein N5079_21795 [Planotetraspora sp. A-T 1434]|uniref:hypothetical protein n=1 Tax=Planotetraspora sp. A-T 1434 TaxID=2979219 RepID=UPI0021BF5085|nr:hypothetical protein [Planotetraspora sp. A-T 1434]MCT9932843.1 hypothetical protein [Planotetraspora sp. A-T 1434]